MDQYGGTLGRIVDGGVVAVMRGVDRDSVVDLGEALRAGGVTAMEVTAIGVGLWIAGDATLGEPLYWTSLLLSLTIGFFAAYPVNLVLIRWGIKSGMGHPGGDHHHGH